LIIEMSCLQATPFELSKVGIINIIKSSRTEKNVTRKKLVPMRPGSF
jgi:hypothetical protein